MKLQFDRKDIEALLIAKAKELGIEANTVEFDQYSSTRTATVYFEASKAEPTTLQVAA